MERFETLQDAAEFAATRCARWKFAYTVEEYDIESLLGLAEIHDEENPADEGSFYLVSPGGAIGFCEDDVEIAWLFLTEPSINEDLPMNLAPASQGRFCHNCGNPTVEGAAFCGKCGAKL